MKNILETLKKNEFDNFNELKDFLNSCSKLRNSYLYFKITKQQYNEITELNNLLKEKDGKSISLIFADYYVNHKSEEDFFTDFVLKSRLFEKNLFIYNFFYNDYDSNISFIKNLTKTLEELTIIYNHYIKICEKFSYFNVKNEDLKEEINSKKQLVIALNDFLKDINECLSL